MESIRAEREQKSFLLGRGQAQRQWAGEVFRLEMMVSGNICEVGRSPVYRGTDMVSHVQNRIQRCQELLETEGKAGIEVHLSPGDESGARFAIWKVDFHDIECWRKQVEGIEAELEKRR